MSMQEELAVMRMILNQSRAKCKVLGNFQAHHLQTSALLSHLEFSARIVTQILELEKSPKRQSVSRFAINGFTAAKMLGSTPSWTNMNMFHFVEKTQWFAQLS